MPAIDLDIILMLCSLLGAGAIAGITTGLFGVGGGFIIVPTLLAILPMFTGDNDGLVHTAIGTSLASIIVSSFRAVQTHRKNDLVDFSVLKAWAPWLLIGVAGGVVLASYMDATALIVVFAVGLHRSEGRDNDARKRGADCGVDQSITVASEHGQDR